MFEFVTRKIQNILKFHFRYDPETGFFTVQREGLYFFTTSLRVSPNGGDNLYIELNGVQQCHMLGEGSTSDSATTSCSATLWLESGDQVHVDCGGSIDLETGDTNMFTGFMI